MTISVAWIRHVKGCEELVMVTDSRLSGDGRTFDACAKVITLPRQDCAVAFAGFSGHAYPMMQQLSAAISAYPPLQRGSVEIGSVKSHALKIFDSMSRLIKVSKYMSGVIDSSPEANFLFGGYCWIRKRFSIWSITYDKTAKKFSAHPAYTVRSNSRDGSFKLSISKKCKPGDIKLSQLAVIGDQADVFKVQLAEKMQAKGESKFLDFEPFEVVRDMLRNPSHSETIGGAPQVVKVYQYMSSTPIGVYWPDKMNGEVYLQGRPILDYEKTDRWILDPDTLSTEIAPELQIQSELVSGSDNLE